MTQYPPQPGKVEAHIRRRLGPRLVGQQKRQRNPANKLVKRGAPHAQAAKAVYSNHKRWKLSDTFAVARACPVGWFIGKLGQVTRPDKQQPHWFDLHHWISLA